MQPDLIGSFALEDKTYDVADWIRTTMELRDRLMEWEKQRQARAAGTWKMMDGLT